MSLFDNFLKFVEEGRNGKNRGIPMGFPRLDKFLRGIQRKKYYLIGAETGSGKTAWVDEAFIINPYNWIVKTNAEEKLKIFYYSFEIDSESKLSKWVSYQIFTDYGIDIDPEHIVGMDMTSANDIENRLSDKNFELIKTYKTHFDKLFEFIEFEDFAINPTGIFKQIEAYCESVGSYVEYERLIEGKPKKIKYYKAKNPNEYVIIIIDHYALIKNEHENKIALNKKLSMDKLSYYLVQLRNKYRVIPVVVSQLNRELNDISRQKFKELTPQLSDFKETGNSQEDANVVLGLMHPKRHNLKEYLGYDLSMKGVIDNFRALFVIKNRGGRDGLSIGLRFKGSIGHFEELPTSEEMNKNPIKNYNKISDFSKPFNELIK